MLYYLASFFTLKNLLMGKFLSCSRSGLIRSRTLSLKQHMPFYVSSCSVHKTTILLDLLKKSDIVCNDDGLRTPNPESWYTRLVHTPFIIVRHKSKFHALVQTQISIFHDAEVIIQMLQKCKHRMWVGGEKVAGEGDHSMVAVLLKIQIAPFNMTLCSILMFIINYQGCIL